MKKTALLMLCAGLGVYVQACAVPVNNTPPYQANPSYGAPATGNDSAMFEVLARLEQLQSEVQQLRGMVEEQAQTISDLERKQSNMYSDLDDRIQLLSGPAQPAGSGQASKSTAGVSNPPAESAESDGNVQAVATPLPTVPQTAEEVKAEGGTKTPATESPAQAEASEK
jgi:TolA-binding protein